MIILKKTSCSLGLSHMLIVKYIFDGKLPRILAWGQTFCSDCLSSWSLFINSPWPKAHRCAYSIVTHGPSSVRPSFTMLKHLLFRNHLADQSQILCVVSLVRGNEMLFAAFGSNEQDGRHAHIW